MCISDDHNFDDFDDSFDSVNGSSMGGRCVVRTKFNGRVLSSLFEKIDGEWKVTGRTVTVIPGMEN
jgi:hypothetical protein